MPAFTASQRELGWNVRIILNARITTSLAGFYQQDDFVTVGELRRELDLCFRLDDDGGQRRPALISAQSIGTVIILDKNDSAPFPTPLPNTTSDYYLVSHDPSCQDTRRNHSTESNCICLQGRPPRRNDPRYLPIGKASDDPFIKTVPIRGKKRLRTASSSPSRSASPTKGSEEIGDDDGFPETIIPKEEAAQTISEFRQNVISAGNSRCAVTGKGSAWWAGDCIGPGVQAAHIVPQVHWNVYPDKDQGVAAIDWLQLGDNGRGLSRDVAQVYRVVTAGGIAQACSVSGVNNPGQALSVPYAAQYWFYSA
ncbi:hypothetical protein F5883DRAFT_588344 [Diaporthe sp. PMI_573]|nr:hypothetical protein F5883DRAFT_588344 [Diaporthaceae sp. PMI_573]